MLLRQFATKLGAFCWTGATVLGLQATALAADCNDCCNKNCPPPFIHCQEGPPNLKFKKACPRPVCDPCQLEHYGYYATCWHPWPFPPDWSHCPVPPPGAIVPVPPCACLPPEPRVYTYGTEHQPNRPLERTKPLVPPTLDRTTPLVPPTDRTTPLVPPGDRSTPLTQPRKLEGDSPAKPEKPEKQEKPSAPMPLPEVQGVVPARPGDRAIILTPLRRMEPGTPYAH